MKYISDRFLFRTTFRTLRMPEKRVVFDEIVSSLKAVERAFHFQQRLGVSPTAREHLVEASQSVVEPLLPCSRPRRVPSTTCATSYRRQVDAASSAAKHPHERPLRRVVAGPRRAGACADNYLLVLVVEPRLVRLLAASMLRTVSLRLSRST